MRASNGGKGTNLSKKRSIDLVQNSGSAVKEQPKSHSDKIDSLLAIYKDNFCKCNDGSCKQGLITQFRTLMKQDLAQNTNTIRDMMNIMMGSPHSEKQVNILIFILTKITVETFPNDKMDEILNLFVVVYLKCSREVQLTFVDDIDKLMQFVKEGQEKIFVQKEFTFNAMFYSIY